MLIQCTKILLEQLNLKPDLYEEEETLFSWHANIITVNRKKVVVLVNDKNRYIVVLYGLKAKDFQRLDEHIIEAIRKTFQDEGIKDEIIEKFINSSKDIVYTKTSNRSMVAKMNKACENVYIYWRKSSNDSLYNSDTSIKANRSLVSDGKDNYVYLNEEMYKDLQVFAKEPIFGCIAAVIKITLDLEKNIVWRRIVVPANITFDKLHKIIQKAFGWMGYHLHQFYIYDASKKDLGINHSGYHKEGYMPILNLVSDKEDMDYDYNDVEKKLEKGIKLSECIPAKMKYNYDFGDNWQHYIEVEQILDDYDKNYPVCLEGEGNAPPEDVGGEYGYEEFIKIIENENHDEYDDMSAWGKAQGYEVFDIEKVNREIKSCGIRFY